MGDPVRNITKGTSNMPEPKENSVLFSLKELKRIEEDRSDAEELEEQKLFEETQFAKEAEEKAAKEAQERAKWEAEERKRQEEEAKKRLEEEERQRIGEAEKRAREEAQRQLEQHRVFVEKDAHARAKKLPWIPIGIAIGVLVLGIGGFGFYAWKKAGEEQQSEKQRIAAQKEFEEIKKRYEKEEQEFRVQAEAIKGEQEKIKQLMEKAENEAQRKVLAERRRQATERASTLATARAKAEERRKQEARKVKIKCKNPADPLCGM